ncbi:hypothetical protein V8G54_025432, partial [Vigna mungo]
PVNIHHTHTLPLLHHPKLLDPNFHNPFFLLLYRSEILHCLNPSKPKISNLRCKILIQQHIARLYIRMNHQRLTRVVQILQPHRHRNGDVKPLPPRHQLRTPPVHQRILQTLVRHQLVNQNQISTATK